MKQSPTTLRNHDGIYDIDAGFIEDIWPIGSVEDKWLLL